MVYIERAEIDSLWQQILEAPAMPALNVHHFGGYSKMRYKKLFTHVESHASAVSLLKSGEQRYIKAINNNVPLTNKHKTFN